MTETEIQKQIIDHLTKQGWMVFRMNSGSRAGTRLHKKGTPDLMAQKDGETIWIEVKKPSGKLSPDQLKKHKEIRANGFIVIVAFSLQDVIENIIN